MRLLNTGTIEFEEFFDESRPHYAILSHRWGEQEVSFQDFELGKKKDGPGYAKIQNFCSFAASRGHTLVWIDTCCIDKKSSAELSEAINSMFRWYRKATVCYAYLADVPPENEASKRECEDAFNQSNWFTRGWTLQELLAPQEVIFLDRDWNIVGTKATLSPVIARITGIRTKYLESRKRMHEASIAVKMSWASQRQTTRTEDMAYCLLGLFDVNMPLFYGENKRAFMRLQLEIIKKSEDESVFAWTSDDRSWGMLAPSLLAFKDSWNISTHLTVDSPPYAMTNKGLAFHVPSNLDSKDVHLEGFPHEIHWNLKLLPLNCARSGSSDIPCICLEWKGFAWRRIFCDRLGTINANDMPKYKTEVIHVRQPGL